MKKLNKQVICGKNMCFGYTGLAQLEGIATDEWLRQILDDAPSDSIDEIVEYLKDRATSAAKKNLKRYHTGFMGTGWTLAPSNTVSYPSEFFVSNFFDKDGRRLADAQDDFNVIKRVYEPNSMTYHWWGQYPQKSLISGSNARWIGLREIGRYRLHPL